MTLPRRISSSGAALKENKFCQSIRMIKASAKTSASRLENRNADDIHAPILEFGRQVERADRRGLGSLSGRGGQFRLPARRLWPMGWIPLGMGGILDHSGGLHRGSFDGIRRWASSRRAESCRRHYALAVADDACRPDRERHRFAGSRQLSRRTLGRRLATRRHHREGRLARVPDGAAVRGGGVSRPGRDSRLAARSTALNHVFLEQASSRGGVVRIGQTRITLDLIVEKYRNGMTPEDMVRAYIVLQLADVYAVIAHYLRRQDEVATYLDQRHAEAKRLREQIESQTPPLTRDELVARQLVFLAEHYRVGIVGDKRLPVCQNDPHPTKLK